MTVQAKICGIKDPQAMMAAIQAGAGYVGLNFFKPSPRYVNPDDAAMLASKAPTSLSLVGLFVNAEDSLIDQVLEAVPLDIIQLHGKEPPERVAEIRARTGREVMKAIGIREREDLDQLRLYEPVVDHLLLDAKAPEGSKLPGGNAVAFDWTLLEEKSWTKPWMLAGGLTPANVATAVRMTGAPCVDTSSGVEDAPGKKNPQLIRNFIGALQGL